MSHDVGRPYECVDAAPNSCSMTAIIVGCFLFFLNMDLLGIQLASNHVANCGCWVPGGSMTL